MRLCEYKPNTIYKILKHINWRHQGEKILFETNQIFLEEQIQRIAINNWNCENDYYYHFTEINHINVFNIKNYYYIFKGVVFIEEAYLDENFKIIHQFCVENNLEIILNKGVPTYELCGICRKDT